MREFEQILPRSALPQPSPKVVKGDYWMPVREFARLHGGAYLLLARPA